MITLKPIGKDQKDVLFNLMQKYLYEMTRYYDKPISPDGNISYPYLPRYFTDADRQAYFFYAGDTLVGFALINTYSFTGEAIDNCVAEFTVFPAFRRNGYAMEAFAALKKSRQGSWQLKYSVENLPAAHFWQKVKTIYHGTEQKLEGSEIAVTFR